MVDALATYRLLANGAKTASKKKLDEDDPARLTCMEVHLLTPVNRGNYQKTAVTMLHIRDLVITTLHVDSIRLGGAVALLENEDNIEIESGTVICRPGQILKLSFVSNKHQNQSCILEITNNHQILSDFKLSQTSLRRAITDLFTKVSKSSISQSEADELVQQFQERNMSLKSQSEKAVGVCQEKVLEQKIVNDQVTMTYDELRRKLDRIVEMIPNIQEQRMEASDDSSSDEGWTYTKQKQSKEYGKRSAQASSNEFLENSERRYEKAFKRCKNSVPVQQPLIAGDLVVVGGASCARGSPAKGAAVASGGPSTGASCARGSPAKGTARASGGPSTGASCARGSPAKDAADVTSSPAASISVDLTCVMDTHVAKPIPTFYVNTVGTRGDGYVFLGEKALNDINSDTRGSLLKRTVQTFKINYGSANLYAIVEIAKINDKEQVISACSIEEDTSYQVYRSGKLNHTPASALNFMFVSRTPIVITREYVSVPNNVKLSVCNLQEDDTFEDDFFIDSANDYQCTITGEFARIRYEGWQEHLHSIYVFTNMKAKRQVEQICDAVGAQETQCMYEAETQHKDGGT